jgi:prevent-host-death family protein
MKIWPVQDAKAKFSEMLDTCVAEGPQMVSKRGVVEAVLVPVAAWEKLNRAPPLTIKDWLLMEGGPRDLNIPPRGRLKRRASPKF